MKMIIALIQPSKLDSLRDALKEISVERFTVTDAEGYGRQRGQSATFRGVEYQTRLLRKISIELVVNDDFVEKALATIESVARTGHEGCIGDGKIFVLPVEQTIQIGGAARGPAAV